MQFNGLFWNLGSYDRAELLAKAVEERPFDVILLAESGGDAARYLSALETQTGIRYTEPPAVGSRRILILSRSNDLGLQEVHASANGRLSVRALNFGGMEFLLAAVHLVSKRNTDESSQQFEAQVLASEIRDVEKRQGHSRTILVGDLNLNPFEQGVVAATGLHAMTTKAGVLERTRVVQDKEYPFFYNPMWGLFGDRTPGPPGSYFKRMSQQVSYDWNLYDQLLIRPDVFPFLDDNVELLTRFSGVELATARGRPNPEVGSDHFPLSFKLATKAD